MARSSRASKEVAVRRSAERPAKPGEWQHLAAVKEADVLTLYVNGVPSAVGSAPAKLATKSKACALGGNPLHTGSGISRCGLRGFLRLSPRTQRGRNRFAGEVNELAGGMKLYLVAGEASGDARGAELIRALRERDTSLQFFGAGGREMRALAGGDFLDWADEAVVGLWDVLKKYGYFKAQFDRMLAHIDRVAPAAVILIDYPGFNLRLAKALRARRFAGKIIYYISPQVWAWNRGRIPQMARILDLMLCIFPSSNRSMSNRDSRPSSSGTR
jgi:hypothetical protein